jgi:hypothetical protein
LLLKTSANLIAKELEFTAESTKAQAQALEAQPKAKLARIKANKVKP